ncbi:MAG: CBS domain-containing protein [Syntrophobacteraceae bacterium]|nr:CBS domain-containing protein [Syntrophobacteraceae bacterium]
MRDLKAGSIMVRPVAIARRNSPARDVALQLLSGLYSGMPVVNDEGQIIGVVTELDLLEAVDEGKELAKLTAEDVMTKETITVDLDTSASKMIKIMREKHIIRLPVTENGKVVGIVSRCDILRTVVDPYLVVL